MVRNFTWTERFVDIETSCVHAVLANQMHASYKFTRNLEDV